jgi:6-phosphofructokinase 2
VERSHRIRSRQERYHPGGGATNIDPIFVRLGSTARAHCVAGGAPGTALDALLDEAAT